MAHEASELGDQLGLQPEQEWEEHHRARGDPGEENPDAADSDLAECLHHEDDTRRHDACRGGDSCERASEISEPSVESAGGDGT